MPKYKPIRRTALNSTQVIKGSFKLILSTKVAIIGVKIDGINHNANTVEVALAELVNFKIRKDRATPDSEAPKEDLVLQINKRMKSLFHSFCGL